MSSKASRRLQRVHKPNGAESPQPESVQLESDALWTLTCHAQLSEQARLLATHLDGAARACRAVFQLAQEANRRQLIASGLDPEVPWVLNPEHRTATMRPKDEPPTGR